MTLSRYAVMDAYTLGELRREYQAADASGRIQLLAKFPKADDEDDYTAVPLPPELAQLAAKDDSTTVRQWIARHIRIYSLNDPLEAVADSLINDPDPFVRACLMENQTHVTVGNAARAFLFATHLERLALMRNPDVVEADELIWKIFDLEDEDKDKGPEDKLGSLSELGISKEQRKELALAFLSNPAAEKNSRLDVADFHEGGVWYETRKRWATVWRLAAKWPRESGVPRAVFQNIATDDAVKAEAYQQATESGPRCNILWSCRGNEQKTMTLGIADPFEACRRTAYSKIWWLQCLSPDHLETVLSGDDKEALYGLANNASLPVEVLEQIATKIGDRDIYYDEVKRTIDRVRERQGRHEEERAKLRDKQGSLTDQLKDELGKIQDQLKNMETSLGSFRSGQRQTEQQPSHTESDPKQSKWVIAILLMTGFALLVGLPLGMTIACSLIAVAVAMLFAK